MLNRATSILLVSAVLIVSFPASAMAASTSSTGAHHFGEVFLMIAVLLIAGKLGNIVERFGQPAVIGELVAGIALSAAGYYGWGFIDKIAINDIVAWAASFGSLLLLFSIGLESNLKEMRSVGSNALRVAATGVILPFTVGTFVLGPLFFGDQSSNAHFFLGAALVATSVGIPSSVLRGLKLTKAKAAQTFLGATVVDDITGLIILAIVSALAIDGEASASLVLELAVKSVGFLVGAIVLGTVLAKPLSRAFSRIHTGVGMKLSLALSLALLFGFLAEVFGLEPIIGAFAAGLLLDAVHFDSYADPEVVDDLKAIDFDDKNDKKKVLRVINKHKHAHIEDLINSVGYIFIPIFFVSIGLQVDFGSLLSLDLYIISAAITLVAFLTKFAAGFAAKTSTSAKKFIGACMVPRGEVGLIFAATGRALDVLNDEMFSVILLVVVATTFIAPPLIARYAREMTQENS